uniref:NADH-ubiquinone oxidoreductase chain 5 n=1 Tax=Nectonemertes cf. mirabilis HC-2011 TaxID=992350 RepID=I1SR47_9BILA|nr:NADH dehydrogenase subunit 5 [Nectonemertes cf. mirabilis HC-2011]ADZ05367.1 NADH dehydrogenase subunit 5 [Nectonemertes cf. mirabilis HC-2011]
MLCFYGLSVVLFTSFFLFSFFLFLFFFLFYVCWNDCVYLFDWVMCNEVGSFLSFSLVFDWISISFSCVVVFISMNVVWFSYYYMGGDLNILRFTWMVVLFIVSMIVLIFVPSLVGLLLGWDGLGLVSFCLVIYYQNNKSLGSGMLTVLSNRVGDVMLLLSIGWCVGQGAWSIFYMDIFYMSVVVAFCIVLAGLTKSAQFPFCSWLPAAMAAPTPVSALVHSSTLVAAGVYLLVRFYDFLSFFSFFFSFLFFVSVFTMVLAGVSAIFEMDMKKIIALSTLSQLSLMMVGISLGYPLFGLFHLFTHALFKALLFLCAGTLIHCFCHVQDLRFLGACWEGMPVVMVFLNISNLALCGFPFMAGFYSKDLILEYSLFLDINFFLFFFLFFSTLLTVSYSFRLTFFCVWGSVKFFSFVSIYDNYSAIYFPMWILSFGSIFSGSFFFWFLFSHSFSFFFIDFFYKVFIYCILVLGLFLGFILFLKAKYFSYFSKYFFLFLNYFSGSMWFLQNLSTQSLMYFPLMFSFRSFYVVDRGWSEIFGGQGVFYVFGVSGSFLSFLATKSLLVLFSFFLFFFLFSFFIFQYII